MFEYLASQAPTAPPIDVLISTSWSNELFESTLLPVLRQHISSIRQLFEEVWNYRSVQPTNVIDMHISNLRRKLDPDGADPIIRTVRGAGYMLRATG